MSIRRYPFGMFDEMERLFGAMSESPPVMDFERTNGSSRLHLEETDDGFVALADLPGFEREEIELTFDDGVLSVRGQHQVARPNGTHTRHINESIHVPGEVDADAIEATYRNGVLEVTLPVADAERSSGHRIDVE